jgi:hypothetical protein
MLDKYTVIEPRVPVAYLNEPPPPSTVLFYSLDDVLLVNLVQRSSRQKLYKTSSLLSLLYNNQIWTLETTQQN